MKYYDNNSFTKKFFNFRTVLLIFISIPTVVLALLMSYVLYIAVEKNRDTLVSMITPLLLQLLTYGTLAIVFTVIVMLIIAIAKYGKISLK